jgi:hypothetical protein
VIWPRPDDLYIAAAVCCPIVNICFDVSCVNVFQEKYSRSQPILTLETKLIQGTPASVRATCRLVEVAKFRILTMNVYAPREVGRRWRIFPVLYQASQSACEISPSPFGDRVFPFTLGEESIFGVGYHSIRCSSARKRPRYKICLAHFGQVVEVVK